LIEGGWICRACWKPNGPGEDRCYRCKTPRDQQVEVAAGSLKEQTVPGIEKRGRMDTELPLLAVLVAWPMWLQGWIGVIAGVLLGLFAVLAVITGEEASAILFMVVAVFAVVWSSFWIFISRSVRRQARWAYAIAAITYLLFSVPWVLGLIPLPQDVVIPDWYIPVTTLFSLIQISLGICAVFLLIASFMREGTGEAATSNEAG
jgi:hypothetical protein